MTTGYYARYGLLLAEFDRVLRPGPGGPAAAPSLATFRAGALWVLVSPLVWSLPGMPGFVALTVIINAANVVALPFLTLCVWLLTSRAEIIGAAHTNRWWEHAVLGALFVLAVWAASQSVGSIASALYGM